MTTSTGVEHRLREGQEVIRPKVGVGASGAALPRPVAALLVRVVVDQHLSLPDTFELTFFDETGTVLTDAGIALGTKITVSGAVLDRAGAHVLVTGEVTTLEGSYTSAEALTIVRGATPDHRLQRVRRTRTILNAKDSDVARQIAQESGLTVGEVTATAQVHPVLAQDNETDWSFLRRRAEETGFEVGVTDGALYFRAPTSTAGAAPIEVAPGGSLIAFEPRVSSSNLVKEVEVRAWDPVNAQAKAVRKPVDSGGVSVGAGDAVAAAGVFGPTTPPPPPPASPLGPSPSSSAMVVFDRAVTVDSGSTRALDDAATALSGQAASGFAEAEGELVGDARVQAGAVLQISGVPRTFAGSWTVTRARHVFDADAGGYRTWFAVTGRQDRSLLALAGGRGAEQGPTRIPGVVGGVVTDIADPLGLGRVKLALPWLSPEYETTWAPVVQLTAGKRTGVMFLPEPEDQVLVAFEFGDLRRPYVVGSVVNSRTGAGGVLEPGGTEPGKVAVKAGRPAAVVKRGLVTPSGNRLFFADDGPPGGGRPTTSQVVLGTSADKCGLLLDAVAGTVTLQCLPGSPPGTLRIECDGNVEIKAGAQGRLTIDGGSQLTLKGQMVNIEGTGPVAVKGKPIQLN
jgi:phage protein D